MALSEIAFAGILKIGTIFLGEMIKKEVDGEGVGYEIFKESANSFIQFGSGEFSNKIKEKYFRTPTIREKLCKILETEFLNLNEYKFDDKFSDYLNYIGDKEANIFSKEELIRNIEEWNQRKVSISDISSSEIREFVDLYFQKIEMKINSDDTIKQYFEIIKTSANVEMIISKVEVLTEKMDDVLTKNEFKTILNDLVIQYPECKNLVKNSIEIRDGAETVELSDISQHTTGTGNNSVIIGAGKNISIKNVNQTID